MIPHPLFHAKREAEKRAIMLASLSGFDTPSATQPKGFTEKRKPPKAVT